MLIRLLRRFLTPFRLSIAAIVLLQLAATMASLYLPSLNGAIIDRGVVTGDLDYIWRTGALMLAVCLVQVGGQVGAAWFGARTAMGMGRDIRATLFGHVLDFSAKELNDFGPPSLITRNTNDVQQVQQLVLFSAFMLVSAPIMMVGGAIMALREDAGLAWLVVVAVIVLGASVGLLVSFMGPLFGRLQTRIDVVNRILREQITGIRVVRAFVRETFEVDRFADANADLTDVTLKVGRLMATMFPVVMLVLNVSSVAVLWFGGHRVAEGGMEIGQLTAFLQYLTQILMSVMMATMILVMAPRAAVCARRIMEVLDTGTSVVAPTDPARPEGTGSVEFDRVGLTYPGADHPVLHQVSFRAEPGELTAIIGSTGSGKSTLVSLVPRLMDATDGRVLVDGVDVREFDQDELWRRMALVPQRAFLFSGSIASNLRYGNEQATDDDLWAVLQICQAADFVADFPDGLDHEIAQGGTNLSGGQRQRLCIARALISDPDIVLLDDSFSALDVATEARLQDAFAARVRDVTRILVAQRVSSILAADRIIVLDEGQVVGIGQHDELLETCPTYAEIVDSQLSAEEVA